MPEATTQSPDVNVYGCILWRSLCAACTLEKWRDQRFNRQRQLRFGAREFLTAGPAGLETRGWEPLRFKTPLHPPGMSADAPKTILNSQKSCTREDTSSSLILPPRSSPLAFSSHVPLASELIFESGRPRRHFDRLKTHTLPLSSCTWTPEDIESSEIHLRVFGFGIYIYEGRNIILVTRAFIARNGVIIPPPPRSSVELVEYQDGRDFDHRDQLEIKKQAS